MNVITLSPWALALAAVLVLALALLSLRLRLTLAQEITVAALRTTVQLLLVGLVLKTLFTHVHLGWITLIAVVMLLIAGREVVARQRHGYTGMWGFGMSVVSMFVASFSVTILALVVLIGPTPWYAPQYAIPLLGMMLGNTMSGVALALDRLTQSAWHQRAQIEGRLLLGQDWRESVSGLRRDAVRVGLIPTVNAMAAAGVVSLPGMMTGQILAGTPPLEAVKYQILVMFLVTACTGFGTLAAVWLGARRLFDERERLRIDRLRAE